MQSVGLYANLTSNGVAISNGLVAVEVDWVNTTTWTPILLRSLRGSQNPNPSQLDNNIRVFITPVNVNWKPQTSFAQGTNAYFNVTLVNSGYAVDGLIAWSVLDAASVPLSASAYGLPGIPNTIYPGLTTVLASTSIPSWAAVGTATIYVNVFTDAPSVGGYPIINETACTFQIKSSFGPSATACGSVKNQCLNFGSVSTDANGLYNSSYRVSPDPVFGTYVAYAASGNATPMVSSVAFQVKATSTPPSASFTYSPSAPYVNGTVYFNAGSSYSYNGTIINYTWNWGDGSKSSTAFPTITHVFHAQGTYSVTLNVTDSQNLWDTYEAPVSVSGPTPPVASFTFTPNPTWINASTKFDASASTSGWNGTGNPPIVSYVWNYGDGSPVNTTSSSVTYHKFTKQGTWFTILTVKDTRGWNGTTGQDVRVQTTEVAPSASFTYSPATPYVNGTIVFDASSSFSYYGTIVNYQWNWGDGSPQQSTSYYLFSHKFTSAGTFTVTLNVTDSMNMWGTTTKPIKVLPLTYPVARFTATPDPTWINATTKFNATASTPGWNGTGNPPIVSYNWSFGDGTVANSSSSVTYHQFTKLGNFLATLTVKDTRGWSNTTTIGVQVNNGSSIYPSVGIMITSVGFTKPPTGLYQIALKYYQPYKGWAGNVFVSILNNGTNTESFNVTVNYSNGTSQWSLGTQSVTKLASLASTVLAYQWNTSLLEPTMNYTITATTSSIPGETNTQNEQYSIVARVKGPGDVLGVGVVNLKDLGIITGNWKETVPPANPLADPLGVGVVNLKDLGFVTGNWKKTYS
jgi:PKD repeat protein